MNKSSIKWIEYLSKAVILTVWSMIMLFLFLSALVRTARIEEYINPFWDKDSVFFNILAIILVTITILCLYWFFKKMNWQLKDKTKHLIMVIVTIFMALFLVWWISVTQYVPRADQHDCFRAARGILAGDYGIYDKGEYMDLYPFLNGMVLYDLVLLIIFKDGAVMASQYINVLYFVAAAFTLYKINENISGRKKDVINYIFLITFYPMAIYSIFCYGNLCGLMFICFSIYNYFRYRNTRAFKNLILCGVFGACAALIKSFFLIANIALAIFLLLDMIMNKKIRSVLGIVVMILIYSLSNVAINKSIESITKREISGGIPKLAWVVMGLRNNNDSYGWWDSYNNYVYQNFGRDTKKVNEKCKSDLFDFIVPNMIKNPKKTVKFFYRKITSEWNNPTLEAFVIQDVKTANETQYENIKKLAKDPYNKGYIKFLDLLQTLTYFGILIFILDKIIHFRKFDINELLIATAMIGAFIFFAFWEAKSQYIAPFYFMQLPYSINGWNYFVNFWIKKLAGENKRYGGNSNTPCYCKQNIEIDAR